MPPHLVDETLLHGHWIWRANQRLLWPAKPVLSVASGFVCIAGEQCNLVTMKVAKMADIRKGGHTRYEDRAGSRQNLQRQARQSEGHKPTFDCASEMRS